VLTGLDYAPPAAGVIVAVGTFGYVASSVFMSFFAEKLERRYWLPVNAVITIGGAVLTALAGDNLILAFVGVGIIFFGFNGWVSPTYALSAESFPTRARSTGFALVDGVGHLGGCFGILALAPYLGQFSVLEALLAITGGMVIAAILAQSAPRTRNRALDEISP
jgi:MFS family permease